MIFNHGIDYWIQWFVGPGKVLLTVVAPILTIWLSIRHYSKPPKFAGFIIVERSEHEHTVNYVTDKWTTYKFYSVNNSNTTMSVKFHGVKKRERFDTIRRCIARFKVLSPINKCIPSLKYDFLGESGSSNNEFKVLRAGEISVEIETRPEEIRKHLKIPIHESAKIDIAFRPAVGPLFTKAFVLDDNQITIDALHRKD